MFAFTPTAINGNVIAPTTDGASGTSGQPQQPKFGRAGSRSPRSPGVEGGATSPTNSDGSGGSSEDNEPVVVDENSNESPNSPDSGESSDSSPSSPPLSPPVSPPSPTGTSESSGSGSSGSSAVANVIGVAPTVISRLFRHGERHSSTLTPVTSPLVSPVASPQPSHHHIHHHPSRPQQPLLPPLPPMPPVTTTLPPTPPSSSNSFVFPSPDGGSLLVQRLVDVGHDSPVVHLGPGGRGPYQPPPPHRLPNSYVSQHPLKPFTTPRTDPTVPPGHKEHGFNLVGHKYLLLDQLEGSHLQRCIDVQTQMEYVCKTVKNDPAGHAFLSAHMRVDGHPHINPVHEVLVGDASTYLIFPPCHVDLHSYVRTKRRLREPQARPLFRQIVAAVHEAHSKGIVLRDLKLRKFVFTDESRINLKLESLEDAVVLEEMDHDLLSDKHGCPAYVSPEILKRDAIYSGRAADMWGLGVMLYTMLVGRYPFHGQEHTGLFAKIRRGQFNIPDSISSRAKCLIRCLLRKEPEDRLSTEDVLAHPWVNQHSAPNSTSLLSASSTSSSARSMSSMLHEHGGSSSGSSRSSRRHAGHHSSTPMSVAPPSAPPPPPAVGASAHLAPPMHPTLIAASAQLAAAAASAAAAAATTTTSGATPLAPHLMVPVGGASSGVSDYLVNAGDQTVPESIQMDFSMDNKD